MNENISKEELTKIINSTKKKRFIFLIVACVLFIAAITFLIISLVIGNKDITNDNYYLCAYLCGICLCLGVTVLVLRAFFFSVPLKFYIALSKGEVKVTKSQEEVDVSDDNIIEIPVENNTSIDIDERSKELVNQYEELYKNGYITLEELEAKKKEILK